MDAGIPQSFSFLFVCQISLTFCRKLDPHDAKTVARQLCSRIPESKERLVPTQTAYPRCARTRCTSCFVAWVCPLPGSGDPKCRFGVWTPCGLWLVSACSNIYFPIFPEMMVPALGSRRSAAPFRTSAFALGVGCANRHDPAESSSCSTCSGLGFFS